MQKIQVTINDSEVTFSKLGRKFRLDAARALRATREKAFQAAVNEMPTDPVAIMSRASAMLDAFAESVIVTDEALNDWLRTAEGFYFAFSTAAKNANPEMPTARIDELYESLDDAEYIKLRDFWGETLVGIFYQEIVSGIRSQFEQLAGITEDASDETISPEAPSEG